MQPQLGAFESYSVQSHNPQCHLCSGYASDPIDYHCLATLAIHRMGSRGWSLAVSTANSLHHEALNCVLLVLMIMRSISERNLHLT